MNWATKLWEEVRGLTAKKGFTFSVLFTTALSYFYLWTHPSMGVDDTCVQRYFADGFAPTQGRSTLFLLNKVFHVAEFTPFVVDFLGVLFLVLAAVFLAALFRRLSQNRIPAAALAVFCCAMVSFPLIGEVFVYYLHNGIGLAYTLTALAVWAMFLGDGPGRYICASLFMGAALSCYESAAMTYLMCIALVMLVRLYAEAEKTKFSVYVKEMLLLLIPLMAGMVFRSLLANLLCLLLGREANMFSLTEAMKWILGPDVLGHLKGMVSLFGRYYFVNGLANLGVAVYLLAAAVFFALSCVSAAKQKRGLLFLHGLLILVIPWSLSILQGTVIPYRSMQSLPIFVGAVAMCLVFLAWKKGKWLYRIALFGGVVLVYNQAFELNKTFYVDYLKYEEDVTTCRQLAYDLKKEATLEKPVVFIGTIEEYGTVETYAYLDEDSLRYEWISRIRDKMGSDSENSYSTVQNLVWYNVFDWGLEAFEGRGTELIAFFKWHGYHLLGAQEWMYEDAESYARTMPVWPRPGSIRETQEYVIVKLGENEESDSQTGESVLE